MVITQLPSRQLTKLSPIPKLVRRNRFPILLRDAKPDFPSKSLPRHQSTNHKSGDGYVRNVLLMGKLAGQAVEKVFAAAEFSVFLETIARQSMFTPTSEDWSWCVRIEMC